MQNKLNRSEQQVVKYNRQGSIIQPGKFCRVGAGTCGFYSCKDRGHGKIVAEVGDEKIYLNEVDELAKNSLYEYLYAIFDVRQIAINSKLIAIEAAKYNISVDSIISLETSKISRKVSKSQYIANNALQHGVVDEEHPFELLPIKSRAGSKILADSYLKFLKVEMVNELRKKYDIKILLEQPEVPAIDLNGIVSHKRGNIESQNSIIIISDFNCPICRADMPVFKELFDRYKDKLRFEYISLSSSLNRSILFAECAAKQDKFWEAHDLLYQPQAADTLVISSLIARLKMQSKECLSCMSSARINDSILINMDNLRRLGIRATPTILINHRTYYGKINSKNMASFIDHILNKTQ